MAFLKMMATAKKNSERGTLISDIREASDTSSELGPEGKRHDSLPPRRSPSAPSDHDEEADIQSSDASMKPRDEAILEDQNLKLPPVVSSDNKTDENPRSLRFSGALHNGADQVNGPTIWEKLKTYLNEFYISLQRRYFQYKGQRTSRKRRHEYDEAQVTERATKNHFTVTGFPVLYDLFGNSRDEYFKDKWKSQWLALDELLTRPCWERTWIVQEIWTVSAAVLQCGATTIKWKTFQKAMDYSEA
jgi:hypothetical protein